MHILREFSFILFFPLFMFGPSTIDAVKRNIFCLVLLLFGSACNDSSDPEIDASKVQESSILDESYLPQLHPVVGDKDSFEQGVTEISPETSPLQFFVTREDDTFRIFSKKDPNNGCALSTDLRGLASAEQTFEDSTIFFDLCHGSQYDIEGNLLTTLQLEYSESMNEFDFEIENGQLILGDLIEEPQS